MKAVEKTTWYAGKNFGDQFKQDWKARVKMKGDDKHPNHGGIREKAVEFSTVMFVPSSENGDLIHNLEQVERRFREQDEFTWNVKLVEKSGAPLVNVFRKRLPLEEGCSLGDECQVCENDAIKCSPKSVVYLGECQDCMLRYTEDENMWDVVMSNFASHHNF